jgi:DNA-binding CsgD family transcriptional regulator
MAEKLTGRELEVLRLVAQGMTTRQVAEHLHLAPKTVEHMLSNEDPTRAIYPKIGVTNRSAAVAWYVEHYGKPNAAPDSIDAMEHLFELEFDYLTRMHQIRLIGNTQTAREMGKFLLKLLDNQLARTNHPPFREAVLRMQARALVELGMVQLETALKGEVFPLTVSTYAKLCRIGRALRDRETLGCAQMLIAQAYHINRKFAKGDGYFRSAYSLLSNLDFRLRCLRGMILSAAYLGDRDRVLRITPKIRSVIDNGQWKSVEYLAEVLEGTGRSQGIVGLESGFRWLDEAETWVAPKAAEDDLAKRLPLRLIQLSISRFEVMKGIEPHNLSELEQLGETSIRLAREYCYPRHQLWMENWLNELLN